MKRPSVLVVDDKENQRKLLTKILQDEFEVLAAQDGMNALVQLRSRPVDVVISDIRMPGKDGAVLLQEIKQAYPETEVILMTAFASVSKAVDAMKAGAFHYLSKPFDPDEALLLVRRAAEHKHLRQQSRDLRGVLAGVERFERLVGKSASMQKLFRLIERAGGSDATALITGESGTGKELVAQAIHARSARKDKPLIPINCGALPGELIESELFGHVKGTFTGATTDKQGLFDGARGGTLFLDEVGELPLAVQVKLNRVLQEKAVRKVGGVHERPVDVRVIAATNIDLSELVKEGRFREDLFYRLNVFPIQVPPLRDRKGDVTLLTAHFVERALSSHAGLKGLTGAALGALNSHSWPGNVRELENAVERALAVLDGDRIGIEHLPEDVCGASGMVQNTELTTRSYREAVDEARDQTSREYVFALLSKHAGNVTQAAVGAGMQRESLHRLMKKHGIRSEDFKPSS